MVSDREPWVGTDEHRYSMWLKLEFKNKGIPPLEQWP